MCVTGGEILSFKNNGSASIIFNCNAECAAVGSEMASGCFYDPNYPPSGNGVYQGSDGSYGVSSGGNLNPGVTGKCCCRG